MDMTKTSKETAVIELETLTPLFIKGKDPDYGEGMYTLKEKTYLLDNDEVCKLIYEKTYGEDGKLLIEGTDYIALYQKLMMHNKTDNEITELYNEFCKALNKDDKITHDIDDIDKADKESLKNKSVQYFLDNLHLLGNHECEKIKKIEEISNGTTKLHPSSLHKKFIQNGRGEHFLPGSSIKGAIRNALLWKMLSRDDDQKSQFKEFVNAKFKWCEEWAKVEVSGYIKSLSGLPPQKQDEKAEQYKKKKLREFATRFSLKDDDAQTPLAKASLDSITFSHLFPEFACDQELYSNPYIESYNKHWKNASNIHRDLSRIIKITDANFIERAIWKKIDIATYNLRDKRFQKRDKTAAELEAADTTTKAWFRITLDLDLAREFFGNNIPTYLQSIENILKTVSEFFLDVAAKELDFYGKATHVGPVHAVKKWYEELLRPAEIEGQEETQLFRLGWGGGMMTKTQFLHLDEPERKRSRDLMNPRDEAIAPQSRCLQVEKANGNNNRNQEDKAIQPLGWCRLRYLGSNIAEATDAWTKAEAERQATQPPPTGCVRATIVDDQSQPVRVRIEEGDYKNSAVDMNGMKRQQIQNLGLQKNSVIFVKLIEQRGRNGKQLINVTYSGKP